MLLDKRGTHANQVAHGVVLPLQHKSASARQLEVLLELDPAGFLDLKVALAFWPLDSLCTAFYFLEILISLCLKTVLKRIAHRCSSSGTTKRSYLSGAFIALQEACVLPGSHQYDRLAQSVIVPTLVL